MLEGIVSLTGWLSYANALLEDKMRVHICFGLVSL